MKSLSDQSIPAINARLLRYLRRMLPEEQARDVIQDAWESLHKSVERGATQIPPDRGPMPFLYRVVRNRAIDIIRRGRRESPTGEMERLPSPAGKTILSEIRAVMDEAAAAYSQNYDGRLILRCLLDRNLSRESVAESLQISERTLRREIAKLISYLSVELRRKGYSPTDLL